MYNHTKSEIEALEGYKSVIRHYKRFNDIERKAKGILLRKIGNKGILLRVGTKKELNELSP